MNRSKIRAFTLNVFQGNWSDLQKTCDLIENPHSGLRLMHADMEQGNHLAHMEALRHFHNFLAAAKSLVDHTRFFIEDHYAGTPMQDAYKQKIECDLSQDPLVKFVQDLRNYMLHRELPDSSMSINVSTIENSIAKNLTTTITIDKASLLAWSGWTKPSLKHLNSADARISIPSISTPYGEKILNFYRWFDSKLAKYHQTEIDEFKKIQLEYSLAREHEEQLRSKT